MNLQDYWTAPRARNGLISGQAQPQRQVTLPKIGAKMLVCIHSDYSFVVGPDYAPSDGSPLIEVEVKAIKKARVVIE